MLHVTREQDLGPSPPDDTQTIGLQMREEMFRSPTYNRGRRFEDVKRVHPALEREFNANPDASARFFFSMLVYSGKIPKTKIAMNLLAQWGTKVLMSNGTKEGQYHLTGFGWNHSVDVMPSLEEHSKYVYNIEARQRTLKEESIKVQVYELKIIMYDYILYLWSNHKTSENIAHIINQSQETEALAVQIDNIKLDSSTGRADVCLQDPAVTPNSNTSPIDRSDECVICMDKKKTVAVVACGHKCLCQKCSKQQPSLCPICRTPVDRLATIYDC